VTRLRDNPGDLTALVSTASERLGLPIADVEKDFWIVELLRSIAQPVDDGLLIFKGGTSLSKAYAIIERFSEDVDVLVAPSADLSSGSRDRLLKAVATRAAADLGLEAHLIISTTGVKRDLVYEYPAAYPDPQRLTAGVRLEMGVRGGPEPNELRDVSSYVAAAAFQQGVGQDEFDEFVPVAVLTLRPERTLVEKLALLHDRASRCQGDSAALAGQGRHIYDVYQLLRTETVREAIHVPGTVAGLAADAEAQSRRHRFPSTPRPDGGFGESPAWADAGETRRAMEAAYAATAGLIWGRVPTFEECLAEVAANSTIL
jgi:hypothetical protein